ncbi:TPA: hypothetical protein VJS49_001637 [Streptococcus pyogenes]|nr:hypothetical protein [Streptococcus pyogenes]
MKKLIAHKGRTAIPRIRENKIVHLKVLIIREKNFTISPPFNGIFKFYNDTLLSNNYKGNYINKG